MSASPTNLEIFDAAVECILKLAYAKHGKDKWGRHELWGILQEEFDELQEEIRRDYPQSGVISELIDIVVVCRRYIETGDRYRGEHDLSIFKKMYRNIE